MNQEVSPAGLQPFTRSRASLDPKTHIDPGKLLPEPELKRSISTPA